MKKIKLLIFILLIIPVFVSAGTYTNEVGKANGLLNRDNYKNTYEKYIVNGGNIKFEYSNNTNKFNSDFRQGGFISMDEYNLTKKNNSSYLFEGIEYWTLSTNGDNVYAITYNDINTAKNKLSDYNGRATEFIKHNVTIHGEGKINNPWYFDPLYKVTAKVDSKYATIVSGNNQYVKGECNTAECTAKIEIVGKEGYQYITNDCNGIYDSTTKILSVKNVKRDTVCNVIFGKGVYVITLNKATPNKIYLKHGENYYRDSDLTKVIKKIDSVEENTGYTYMGYFYKGNKIINGDKEPSPADDKKILYDSVVGKYITSNVTLDPTWKANTYTVTFNCNGGSGDLTPQVATYDELFTLTSNVCQRGGYIQTKWNTKKDGTGETWTVNNYTNYEWKLTNNITLYAIWTICPIGTYSPVNSNTCTSCPPGSYNLTTGNTSCDDCPVGKYCTGGENNTDCPAGTYRNTTGGKSLNDCTKCAIGSYTNATGKTSCTACQASGNSGANGTTSSSGATSCNASCNKAHASTWETASWNTNNTLTNNCKIKTCTTGYSLVSNVCNPNTYTISYAGMDGATHGASHPTTATYDSAFTINNPKKSGYTFTGWKITGMDSVTHTYGSTTTTATSINSTKETSFKNLRSTSGIVTFTATWSINQYTLTINPNGGTWGGKTTNSTITQNYNTTYTVSNPTAGPTYKISYNMNSTGIDAPTTPTSVQRPFNEWSHSGSGTWASSTKIFTFGGGNGVLTASYNTTSGIFILPGISLTGNSCKWAEGSTSGTQYAGGTSKTTTKDITYYAKCNPNTYPIIYKDEDKTTTLNGGSPANYTYGVGATINWKPTKANKTFNGWSENTSLTGASFTKTISTTATGTKTFYSKWCQNCAPGSNATCNLNANTAGACTYTTGCDTGYHIKSGSNAYNPVCEINTYTVTFNKNNNSATGTMSNLSMTYGTAKTLTANAFALNGYTFNGWDTKSDGSGTKYNNQASVNNLTKTNNAIIPLYARWCPNCINDPNGSCSLNANTAGTCKYTTSCYTGYTLTAGNGTNNPICTANTFTVTYNANSGSGTTASHTCTYNANCTLANNGFAKNGYTFVGWKKANTGNTLAAGSSIKNAATSGIVIYYAQWEENHFCPSNEYTLKNDLTLGYICTYAPGTVTVPVYSDIDYNELDFDCQKACGHNNCCIEDWIAHSQGDFIIFKDEDPCTGLVNGCDPKDDCLESCRTNRFDDYIYSTGTTQEPSCEVGTYSTRLEKCYFEANSVFATLDPNGGSVSPISILVKSGGTYGSSLPTPTRTDTSYGRGYKFMGWYTSASGGTKVSSNTTVTAITNHTLYAHWALNYYCPKGEIEYNASKKKYVCTTYYNERPQDPSNTEQIIWVPYCGDEISYMNGWETDGARYCYKDVSTIDSTKQVVVEFDANGGTISPNYTWVTKNNAYGELKTPTRTGISNNRGYYFTGWYTAKTGGSNITATTIVSQTTNHKLFAHWDLKWYCPKGTIEYDDSKKKYVCFVYVTREYIGSDPRTGEPLFEYTCDGDPIYSNEWSNDGYKCYKNATLDNS